MPLQAPPRHYTGQPVMDELAAGTVLSLVHRTDYLATAFNPHGAPVLFGGGRFDSTADDPYGYLYAGESDQAALAEALLRDIEANDHGYRFLAKRYWSGRQLSRVRLTAAVPVVSLRSGVDLGAIGQDTWLTTCDPDDYPQTRTWAHWLRGICDHATGIVWASKREPSAEVYVLFEDRCPPGLLEPANEDGLPRSFAEEDGVEWLRQELARYRVAIRASLGRGPLQTDTSRLSR